MKRGPLPWPPGARTRSVDCRPCSPAQGPVRVSDTRLHQFHRQQCANTRPSSFPRVFPAARSGTVRARGVSAPCRAAFHPEVATRVLAEVAKDLTSVPTHDLAKRLSLTPPGGTPPGGIEPRQ